MKINDFQTVVNDDKAEVQVCLTVTFPNLGLALGWLGGQAGAAGAAVVTAPAPAPAAATPTAAPATRTRAATKPVEAPAPAPVQTTVTPAKPTAAAPPAPAPAPVVQAPVVQAPAPAPVVQAPAPVAAPTGAVQIDPELYQATSFRAVMLWMIKNGFVTKEAIVAQCDVLREHVPAIGRLPGDIGERISRALEVLKGEGVVAATA